MSESEILQGLFDAISAVLTIFSLFFTMVSGYLAALYLFLHRAPLILRFMAFSLLSVGLVFLGGTAAVVQTMQNSLFATWDKLPNPSFELRPLRNPLPVDVAQVLPFTQQELGVGIGWFVAVAVYAALAFMTFIYRWPQTAAVKEGAFAHAGPNSDARVVADHGGGQARQVAR